MKFAPGASPPRRRRAARLALGALVVGMALLSAGCDAFLSGMIFFPERRLDYTPQQWGLDHQEIWCQTADGLGLHGWHLPAPMGRTLILYYHGNAGNISHRLDLIARLVARGMGVYILDYRGYGRSEGSPSEEGFYLDAEAAHAQAAALARADGRRLVVMGHSLGGAAAVHAAARLGCAGVILESTFPHLGAMARHHYFLPFLDGLLRSRFDSLTRVKGLRAPVLFVHGDQDQIVPLALGRALFAAAPEPKEFLTLEGAGHNDTYLRGGQAYFDRLSAFVEGLPPGPG